MTQADRVSRGARHPGHTPEVVGASNKESSLSSPEAAGDASKLAIAILGRTVGKYLGGGRRAAGG